MTPYDLGKACLIHLVDVTEAVTCVSNGHRHINYTNSIYKKKMSGRIMSAQFIECVQNKNF